MGVNVLNINSKRDCQIEQKESTIFHWQKTDLYYKDLERVKGKGWENMPKIYQSQCNYNIRQSILYSKHIRETEEHYIMMKGLFYQKDKYICT